MKRVLRAGNYNEGLVQKIAHRCSEPVDSKDKRASSVLRFAVTAALALAGFLEAGTLEEEEATGLAFAPVELPRAVIVGRKPD